MTNKHTGPAPSPALAENLSALQKQQSVAEELESLREQLATASQAVTDAAQEVEDAKAARHNYAQTRQGLDMEQWEPNEKKRHAELSEVVEQAQAAHAEAAQLKAERHQQIRDAEARRDALNGPVEVEQYKEHCAEVQRLGARVDELRRLIAEQEEIANTPLPECTQSPPLREQREELLSQIAMGTATWGSGETIENIDRALDQAKNEHSAACALAHAQQETARATMAGLQRHLENAQADLSEKCGYSERMRRGVLQAFAQETANAYEQTTRLLWKQFKELYALGVLIEAGNGPKVNPYWAEKIHVPRWQTLHKGKSIAPNNGKTDEPLIDASYIRLHDEAALSEPVAAALASAGIIGGGS